MKTLKIVITIICLHIVFSASSQVHPEIYTTNAQREAFFDRLENSNKAAEFVAEIKLQLDPYVDRHQADPEWIVSRLQMYWESKYKKVYVNGMDFSW